MKPEGGFPDGGSPARPGRGGEWGEPWPCCEERSREPSPAPDCLQRKIETLRSHPTEIFNFMVVGGTPRLGEVRVPALAEGWEDGGGGDPQPPLKSQQPPQQVSSTP